MSVSEYNKKRAIFEYLKKYVNENKRKVNASVEAAELIYIEHIPGKSKFIRYLASYWLRTNLLPVSQRGKHQKTVRLIDDEDIAETCHKWIRSQGGTTTPAKFKEFVDQKLFIEKGITKNKNISIKTASRWLNVLGYHYQKNRQDIFFDGHERSDVIEYRHRFIEKMFEYEKFMTKYDDETLEPIAPVLKINEREIILVTHDECIFYSYDGKRGVWAKNGELPLKKKGNGRSIMVSDFLTEACGRLKLNQEHVINNPHVPEKARVILKPGKNQDGYWTNEHLIEQVELKAIPIFEALFPGCIALFAFDHSSNHSSYKSDALVASRMNMKPGGNQPKMRNTTYGPNNTLQTMTFEDGTPKGMKQVLGERGWTSRKLQLMQRKNNR